MPVFLFTDIEDSTKKWEKYSAAMPKVLKRHDDILGKVIKDNGGRIIKHTGDGVFASFNTQNGVKAAIEIEKMIGSEKWDGIGELRVRIGIHAGEAEERGDDYFGPEINKTARVLSLGWGGQILATPEAIDGCVIPEGTEVTDMGFFTLKGVEAPQKVFGVVNNSVKWLKFPPLKSSTQLFFNMPSYSTPFTGRDAEAARIYSFFSTAGAKCMTLVAQGGMGKSRLAAEAVRGLSETYLDGIAYIELAPLDTPDKIPFAVANVLNYTFYEDESPVKQLVDYFKDRKMLLVLDNFEHLLEGRDFISQIILNCPRTAVLATSRAILGMPGETVLELRGLDYSADGPAVKLFWEHASRYSGGREFDDDEKKAAVEFCRVVDGLPLAMELAAPWLKVLSVSELVKEMQAGADILKDSKAGAKHSSMRSLFEYSYGLLSESERRIMRRLTLFTGGFGRQAAVKVTGASLSELMSLSDKSFIKVSAPSRFVIHELIRQYAFEKFSSDAADVESVKREHTAYFTGYIRSMKGQLTGPRQRENMEAVSNDIENIISAWDAVQKHGGFDSLYEAAEPVFNFYELRNRFVEGADVFMTTVKKIEPFEGGRTDAFALSSLLKSYAGALYRHIGAFDNSEKQLLAGIDGLKKCGKVKDAAHGLNHLGLLYEGVNKYDKAMKACTESHEIYTGLNDTDSAAFSGMVLASVLYSMKEYDRAYGHVSESMKVYEHAQNMAGFAWSNYTMAQIEMAQEKMDTAKNHFETGIRIYKHVMDKKGVSWGYNMLCELEIKARNYDEARRLCVSGLKIRLEIGDLLGELYSYTNLGIIALHDNKLQEAFDNAVTAFRLSMKAKADFKAAENLTRIAEIYFRQGKLTEAVRCASCVSRFTGMEKETKEKAQSIIDSCALKMKQQDIDNIQSAFRLINQDEIVELFS